MIIKKSLKIILYLFLFFLALSLLIMVIFYVYNDEIKDKLVSSVNELQSGEIVVGDLDLSLFHNFPIISLHLQNVKYFEHSRELRKLDEKPFSSFEDIYVTLDIVRLINGMVEAEDITLNKGSMHLIRYPDSTLNIQNALGLESDEQKVEAGTKSFLDLDLRNIAINDIQLILTNNILDQKGYFFIHQIKSSFQYIESINVGRGSLDCAIINIECKKRTIVQDSQLKADLDFQFNEQSLSGVLKPSQIEIDNLSFLVEGAIDLKSEYIYNFNVEIKATSEDLLKQIFSEELIDLNIDSLKTEAIFIKGNAKGESFTKLPVANFQFGIKDLSLRIPGKDLGRIHLGLNGYFHTGRESDLSKAIIEVDYLQSRFPRGNLSADFKLTNLQKPNISLNIDSEIDITGIEDVLRIPEVDSLRGFIDIESTIDAVFDIKNRRVAYNQGKGKIQFRDVDIKFSNPKYSIENLSGIINKTDAIVLIEDLYLRSWDSDIRVSGETNNVMAYLLGIETPAYAKIKLKSNKIVLTPMLSNEVFPVTVFGDTIINFSTDVTAEIIPSSDTSISAIPDFKVNIDHLRGDPIKFPEIQNFSGNFVFNREGGKPNLVFKNAQVKTSAGDLFTHGSLIFLSPQALRFSSSLLLNDFDYHQFVIPDSLSDTLVFSLAGKLSGNILRDHNKHSPFLSIDKVVLSNGKFVYKNLSESDTLESLGLQLNAEYINLESQNFDDFLSNLKFKGNLKTRLTRFNQFRFPYFASDFTGKSGIIRLTTSDISMFGVGGKIAAILDFSEELQVYRFEHHASGYDIEHLIGSFTQSNIMSGSLDIDVNIAMTGRNWEENLKSLSGEIKYVGKDLTINGADIDDLLDKFMRTQTFNLMDVGAYMFAGPAGALVTKSVDYANILATDPGVKSTVRELKSHWQLENGIAEAVDMAFSTDKSRVAFAGSMDLVNSEFHDFAIAVVDRDGCIVISQELNGKFENPQFGKLNTIKTILSPVTNLFNSITGKDCEPFYEGEVTHPKD